MTTWSVGFPDEWAPRIAEAIDAERPDDFVLRFAEPTAASRMELARECDFLLSATAPIDAEQIDAAEKLLLVQKWGIGFDNIDLAAARRAGIGVAITAGANAHAVAEHAVMMMLASLRHLSFVDRELRDGNWLFKEMRVRAGQLCGRRVGILGMGNIGRAVARRLQGFGVRIGYYDPRRAPTVLEAELHAEYMSFEQLLEWADVLTVHCPGGEQNHHLISDAELATMKAGSVLVNTARGTIVDQAALVNALSTGKLAAAGLDVFEQEPIDGDNPLLTLDNVVLSPHTAASVLDNVGNVARHAFGNMERIVRGETLSDQDIIVAPDRSTGPQGHRT